MATSPVPSERERNRKIQIAPSIVSDDILMERVCAGEHSALMAIYDRYSALVFGLSLHVLGNPQSAEDVVQEVFLRIWRNAHMFSRGRGSLAGWITVMARHQAIDNLRKTQREHQLSTETVEVDPEPAMGQGSLCEDAAKVRSILERLPWEQREVLDLAYFGGLTHSEIAARTGLALGTVKSRIRLALRSLRQFLQLERTAEINRRVE